MNIFYPLMSLVLLMSINVMADAPLAEEERDHAMHLGSDGLRLSKIMGTNHSLALRFGFRGNQRQSLSNSGTIDTGIILRRFRPANKLRWYWENQISYSYTKQNNADAGGNFSSKSNGRSYSYSLAYGLEYFVNRRIGLQAQLGLALIYGKFTTTSSSSIPSTYDKEAYAVDFPLSRIGIVYYW